jgi:hypothetical protein
VTGYTAPSDFLRFDGLDDELVDVGTHPSENCVICGADELLGVGKQTFGTDALVGGDGDGDAADSDGDSLGSETESQVTARAITNALLSEPAAASVSERASDPATSPMVDSTETAPGVSTATQAIESTAWGSADDSDSATAQRQAATPSSAEEENSSAATRLLKAAWNWKGLLGLAALGVLAVKRLRDHS